MSSPSFGVTLQVDPRGRRIVRCSGCALALAGSVLILLLPLAAIWRILLLLVWLADCGWSLWRLQRGFTQVSELRLDAAGNISVGGPADRITSTSLVSGSVVSGRFAWLRFRLADGSGHSELLLPSCTRTYAWHRFQLIWRLCRDTFGHRAGA